VRTPARRARFDSPGPTPRGDAITQGTPHGAVQSQASLDTGSCAACAAYWAARHEILTAHIAAIYPDESPADQRTRLLAYLVLVHKRHAFYGQPLDYPGSDQGGTP
jgi:hypothetical protein